MEEERSFRVVVYYDIRVEAEGVLIGTRQQVKELAPVLDGESATVTHVFELDFTGLADLLADQQ